MTDCPACLALLRGHGPYDVSAYIQMDDKSWTCLVCGTNDDYAEIDKPGQASDVVAAAYRLNGMDGVDEIQTTRIHYASYEDDKPTEVFID